ncbi:MAG: hypothetical protein RPS47_16125 [Colwellia sp.]|jgi:hypothetical protein
MSQQEQANLESTFFKTTWPMIRKALVHYFEVTLPYKDDRYEEVSPALNEVVTSIGKVKSIIDKVTGLNDRFYGEVLYCDKALVQAATYSLIYIGQELDDVSSIINSFGLLSADPYIKFSLGNEYSKKLKSIYIEVINEFFQELGELPEADIAPSHWIIYRNNFCNSTRSQLLDTMSISPLLNVSFPPRETMNWFSNVAFDEDNYLSTLLEHYVEAGLNDSDILCN